MKFKQLSVFAILLILNYNHVFSQKKQQPNVVLIVIDDLNDYTGFLGGHPQVKTPNMDALAKNGLVFTNAHANAQMHTHSHMERRRDKGAVGQRGREAEGRRDWGA